MNQAEWTPLPEAIDNQARRNWYALCFHRAELAKALNDPLARLSRFEVCLRSGVVHGLRITAEPEPHTYLPADNGPALLEQQQVALRQHFQSGKRVVILSGLCSGRTLDAVKQLLDEFASSAVCLIEPHVESWCAALLDATIAEVFQHPRLFLFGGANAFADANDFLKKEYLFLLPHHQFAYMLGVMPSDEQAPMYIQAAKDAAASIQAKNTQFEEILAGFLTHTQSALAGAPQSVWACTHRESYIHFPLLRAFLRGFHQCGLHTRLSEYDHGFTTSFRVMGELLKAKPDCIFSINTWAGALLEDFGLSADAAQAMKVPRVSWLVDDTQLYEDAPTQSPFSDYDWVIASDRSYLPWLERLTKQAFFMPPAAMFEKKGAVKDDYACPISYVGSLPNIGEELKLASATTLDILKRIEEQKRKAHSKRFLELLDEFSPSADTRNQLAQLANQFTSQTLKNFQTTEARVEYFLYNAATYFKRLSIVEALLPLGLVVCGPDAWRDALPDKFKHRCRAFVPNDALADIYASSQLCLNIHSHQCPTCLNTRDFDAPMAGGAVIGDWVEDIERGFLEPGKETLTFRSNEEAVELIQQALADRDALAALRRNGRNRVIGEHTYKHRAQRVLSQIRR